MTLSWSIALVYAYTAFAKTEAEWLSGAALRSVVRLPPSGEAPPGVLDPIGPFRDVLGFFGLEGEPLFWFLGHQVVLVQIICAAGYLVAPFLDLSRHWLPRAFAFVALATALSFHLGAEYMDLKIGWFSWYMVGYALIFFLPARWLAIATRVIVPLPGGALAAELMALRFGVGLGLVLVGASAGAWTEMSPFGVSLAGIFGAGFNTPLVLLGIALLLLTPVRLFARAPLFIGEKDASNARALALSTLAAGALALGGAGYLLDLPGAWAAGVIAAVALGAGLVATFLRGDDPRALHGLGVGAVVAALALFSSIALSEVRWDFYRNIGGDHRRRGEHRMAYEAYVKANLYAPEGQDRLRQQREMEDILRARGELSGEPNGEPSGEPPAP